MESKMIKHSFTSLSRIMQHVDDPKRSFGVITSYRSDRSDDDNRKSFEVLKSEVRSMGYGYSELAGGYNGDQGPVQEPSLFVPKISKDQTIKLGVKYDQHAVLYKDDKEFSLIGTNKNSGIGNILS
jgi:hypothetical protein